jgi:hypothetical protein
MVINLLAQFITACCFASLDDELNISLRVTPSSDAILFPIKTSGVMATPLCTQKRKLGVMLPPTSEDMVIYPSVGRALKKASGGPSCTIARTEKIELAAVPPDEKRVEEFPALEVPVAMIPAALADCKPEIRVVVVVEVVVVVTVLVVVVLVVVVLVVEVEVVEEVEVVVVVGELWLQPKISKQKADSRKQDDINTIVLFFIFSSYIKF